MTTPREQFEQSHSDRLASWAVREADSGGRALPEESHPYRTCFQRDRDRIVHSSAFRRLDFKTQVFVPHECDHNRTRLTHTLEVAQVARNLARALGLNEDVCEAVALAHDLGHPPFGHAGQDALNELMAAHGGFEHNRQSLRVVDYLEHPYPQFRGLNLTRVVRQCLAKHETAYDSPACDEFTDGLQAPLEGQIVDLADEIAYTSADLEDSLAAGILSIEQVSGLELWQEAWAVAQRAAPDARDIHKRIRACKAVLAAMADDLIATTQANLAATGVRTLDDVQRAAKCAAFSDALAPRVKHVQKFLLTHVYLAGQAAEQQAQCRTILSELFGAYMSDPSHLPNRYQSRIESDSLPRVVCDYIAGMTDRFCQQAHASVCG